VAARAIGRPYVREPCLGLRNYVNNLRCHGYTEADHVAVQVLGSSPEAELANQRRPAEVPL
jgi:hypothetical protein